MRNTCPWMRAEEVVTGLPAGAFGRGRGQKSVCQRFKGALGQPVHSCPSSGTVALTLPAPLCRPPTWLLHLTTGRLKSMKRFRRARRPANAESSRQPREAGKLYPTVSTGNLRQSYINII